MRQITEVLRLAAQGLSYRQIGQSVGISASTVQASRLPRQITSSHGSGRAAELKKCVSQLHSQNTEPGNREISSLATQIVPLLSEPRCAPFNQWDALANDFAAFW